MKVPLLNIIFIRIKQFFRMPLNSTEFVWLLQRRGITVGDNTHFFSPEKTVIDTQRPWLIKIGDYCKITQGVVILSHDYSRSVLRRVYGEVVGEAGKTVIGNNVFIGMNSIILMGTSIGDNTIIGAGSVCKGKYPDNVVIAGNPAKIICTLDDYYHKRKSRYIEEAKLCAREYYLHYGKKPTINEMNAFFPLYLERSEVALRSVNTRLSGDNENEIISCFLQSDPTYDSFEAFLEDAIK